MEGNPREIGWVASSESDVGEDIDEALSDAHPHQPPSPKPTYASVVNLSTNTSSMKIEHNSSGFCCQ
ncbi:uncharacterized protein G2W53_003582 [Senna tora]|uniref:Uncharacterized protein n=1 Tax=Senna tora TaxID=362788 RepID=A0A834XAE6_9FABA|nr:uncharacterized protein G2W53_003582 [Senna tora]